jgi:predicted RNA-binding protein with PUA-like domain
MKYWLMKSEPNAYSIDDLQKDKKTHWDGVRNYQARNFMRDEMEMGDKVFFYHSNAEPPGITGIAEVCSKPYPDKTQFDQKSKYYDPKATKEQPRWYLVDIQFKKKLKNMIPLPLIKEQKTLKDMKLIQKGQRLSIQPITKKEWEYITKLSE